MKIKVAIAFGGNSSEHEVSLKSASSIYNAIDKSKFDVILLGNDRNGEWRLNQQYSKENINLFQVDFFNNSTKVNLNTIDNVFSILDKETNIILTTIDVVFPIIHGNNGEDGALQGYFKFMNIPFAGPDILGSAICMDKEVTKRLLAHNNIPIADYICLSRKEKNKISFEEAKQKLGLPMFVKPCNAGSSVGVSKIVDEDSFIQGLEEAFKHDSKILIEEAIIGKEVECAVLGNEYPKASIIGEIIPTKDFYSYDAKYNDADGAKMKIPADVKLDVIADLQRIAIKAFETTCCEGMARVDFFLKNDNTYVVNEINTLPGFTEISMYPKLWEKSGVTYTDLITEIINLAWEKHKS